MSPGSAWSPSRFLPGCEIYAPPRPRPSGPASPRNPAVSDSYLRKINTHQLLVSHNQAGVHNLAAPFRRHVFRGWRTLPEKHPFDFGAQTLLVELERGLALAVESQVRIQLHSALLYQYPLRYAS